MRKDRTGELSNNGLWRALSYARNTKLADAVWNIECVACGSTRAIRGTYIQGYKGRCKVCNPPACMNETHFTPEELRDRRHGLSKKPVFRKEYFTWQSMIQRCTRPSHPKFHRYGGRGITVCDRWRRSFKAFLQDVGPKPAPGLSIDRIDNDGNYEPGNVRWADSLTQQHNKSR